MRLPARTALAGLLLLAVTAITPLLVTRPAASAGDDLPPVAADQLVASAARALASRAPVSGRVAAHIDLGVPDLSDSQLGPVAGGIDSLWGDHRLRVWASPDGLRVADLLPGAERSLVASPAGGWAWDSSSFTAYRVVVRPPGRALPVAPPQGSSGDATPDPSQASAVALDPLTLARRALADIDPSTLVTARPGAAVAGRPAYLLTLEPRGGGTLVDRVEVGIDAERRVPLRVAIFARGAGGPAISAAFTSVGFAAVPAATFRFSPPPGATVRSLRLGMDGDAPHEDGQFPPEVRTFGTGWESVMAVRVPAAGGPAAGAARSLATDLARLLPFSGPLLSARLVERPGTTWLLLGMVPQSRLAAVAGSLR